MYTCFKRNDKKDIKVAQLAGSVAEVSAYHHGEVRSTVFTLKNVVHPLYFNSICPCIIISIYQSFKYLVWY